MLLVKNAGDIHCALAVVGVGSEDLQKLPLKRGFEKCDYHDVGENAHRIDHRLERIFFFAGCFFRAHALIFEKK